MTGGVGSKARERMQGDSKVSNQSDGEDGGEVDTMIQDQGPRRDWKTLNGWLCQRWVNSTNEGTLVPFHCPLRLCPLTHSK